MDTMKNGVPAELYYSLLEWKDQNLQEFQEMHGPKSLNEFTPNELHMLHRAILSSQVFEVGEKVHYIRDNCNNPAEYENGIVKEILDRNHTRVVYNCGGDWDNYRDYTSALTDNMNLRRGWV